VSKKKKAKITPSKFEGPSSLALQVPRKTQYKC
jgi:hypothetical protein